MSDVDKLQEAEEWASQREDEQAIAERAEQEQMLAGEPVHETAQRRRSFREIALADISTIANVRPDLPNIVELASSIRQVGLLQPLVVRPLPDEGDGERFQLTIGRRRFAALGLLEEQSAPCMVIEALSDAEVYDIMLIENIQREEVPAIHVARALQRQLNVHDGLTAAELARSLGFSPAWASRHMKLLDLPESVQAQVEAGDLSFTAADLLRRGHARGELSEQEVTALADKVVAGEASTADVKRAAGFVPPPPENYEQLSRELDEARWAAQRGAKNDPVGTDAEQRDWESADYEQGPSFSANQSPRGVSGIRPEGGGITPETGADHALQDDLANTEVDSGEVEIERPQLQSYLLGRMLRDHAPERFVSQLGIDAHEVFTYGLGLTEAERLERLDQIALYMLSEDDAPPPELFGAPVNES